jgi:hypothetical protein
VIRFLQVAVFACDYANGKSADSDCLSLDGAWRCASAQKTGAKGTDLFGVPNKSVPFAGGGV